MSRAIKNDIIPLEIVSDPVPLRIDEGGTVRVGKTRVTIDIVVAAFNQGATAEEIMYMFPGLELADVYAVISYYLRRREEVDAYLQRRQEFADEVRKQNQARFDSDGIRDRLLARRARQAAMEKC